MTGWTVCGDRAATGDSGQFKRRFQSLLKKDRDLRQKVEKALELRRKQGPVNDHLLKRTNGRPVFKMRVQAQGRGKRGDARVIYYCDHKLLFSLWTYLKSQQENMSEGDFTQITDILQAADLWGPSPLG